MKAIHADPKEVRKLFVDTYLIPDFQRPYSWEVEQCEKLWEDITDFFDQRNDPNEKYFLGNLVIHPDGKEYHVIDGQQRLTTLLLLLKSFHMKAGVVVALERCLKKEDPLTAKLTNEMRVNSNVVNNDKNDLYDIIFNDGRGLSDCRMKTNFEYFTSAISEWWLIRHNDAEVLNDLILTFLDQVVLLPIHCSSEDDALTIFETINNRGMSLTDADIFKAKLYAVSENKDKFIKEWQSLEEHEWLFRIHMHISRAKNNDYSKEIGLRSYFSDKSKLQLDYVYVMESIKLYQSIWSWSGNTLISTLWSILDTYPNYYWNFPLYTFLRKHGSLDEYNNFCITDEKINEFSILIQEVFKFAYIKGIVYNSVNAIKDVIYKVCVLIWQEKDYLSELNKSYSGDLDEALRKIVNGDFGRYQRGFVVLASMLNTNQDRTKYLDLINSGYHIEHILPKKWNDYDGWTEDSWKTNINSIGNLVPLEWKININAQNEYFPRKQDKYKQSVVQDVLDLCSLDKWMELQVKNRSNIQIQRILDFFNSKTAL